MPAAARPSARSAADGPQGRHRSHGGLPTAQTQLAVALLEKVASGTGQATVSPANLGAALGIVSLGADPAMKAAVATVSGFAPERGEADLAALVDGRSAFASSREAFRAASRIAFAPSNPPNRITRAGLKISASIM
jgi:hypothetical protein